MLKEAERHKDGQLISQMWKRPVGENTSGKRNMVLRKDIENSMNRLSNQRRSLKENGT